MKVFYQSIQLECSSSGFLILAATLLSRTSMPLNIHSSSHLKYYHIRKEIASSWLLGCNSKLLMTCIKSSKAIKIFYNSMHFPFTPIPNRWPHHPLNNILFSMYRKYQIKHQSLLGHGSWSDIWVESFVWYCSSLNWSEQRQVSITPAEIHNTGH